MATNRGIDQLNELTDLSGDWDLEVFDNDEVGVGVLKNKYATRERLIAEITKPDVATITPTATEPLALGQAIEMVEVSLTLNWAPSSITGLIKGKLIKIRIGTNGLATAPYQITWPANISFNDGIEPVLVNNDATKYDWIFLQGIDDSGNAQIIDTMLAG